MLEIELELERKASRPTEFVKQNIDRLRETHKIAFISDMYPPSKFIAELLMHHNIMKLE